NSLQTHCGACTQCFDRRFAILHAGLVDFDPEEIYATDVLFGERTNGRSITMAVEWTRHALLLGTLDEQGFMERFGHEVSRILRGHSELSRKTTLDLTFQMHQRHSKVVRDVLENVLRDRAADLVARRFPQTSLVHLHLGSGSEARGVPTYLPDSASRASLGEVEEVDQRPEAREPLRVAFSMIGGRHLVEVIGLTSVTGPPARVPHALKPAFDEDRKNGAAPEEYQYIVGTTLPDLANMTKDTIRKSVQRCRKQLAEEYEWLHGERPPEHLL